MASDTTIRANSVSEARLWFAVAMGFFAWHLSGTAGMFITWRAGLHHEAFGNACSAPWAYAAAFASIGFLLLLTIIAAIVGTRDWHRLTGERHIWDGEGLGRKDFMAMIGVYTCFTLGVGMVWMLIAHFILQYCLRMR